MAKYTAYNLVRAVSLLPRNTNYNYVNPRTPGLIHIENVNLPAGPIQIRRWNPRKGENYVGSSVESISSEMIWRVANAVNLGEPINLDRMLMVNKEAQQNRTRTVSPAAIPSKANYRVKSKKHL